MHIFRPRALGRAAVRAVCALGLVVLLESWVWATVRTVASRTIAFITHAGVPAFGTGARGGGLAASIAASMSATVSTDADSDGRADPGDTIRYSATLSNRGTNQTGVQFSDTPDSNTTLVPGPSMPRRSPSTTPAPGSATHSSIRAHAGWQRHRERRGGDRSVHAEHDASERTLARHCALSSNGHFVYMPAVGYTGADTFTYRIINDANGALTCTGTVTINLTSRVWYLQASASGAGRSNTPSDSPSAISPAATAASMTCGLRTPPYACDSSDI